MPPPLKNAITTEHEELLWNNKLLSTDTSIGLIQAVIFYLIKCFGLWQGRDLKLIKTEHVTFDEDELGKFVAIDIRQALGSGRVIKRYDDQGNPRSVYKIMKTYKGYLANEGPFLVRPISSIKDYICYSPWPVGLTILEQTVVNIMQDCGVGPGFGNVSVCLMSIDILKSFGTGGHCISTWFSRLYPKYKKTFWAEAFLECSDMNCEDKNQEACLMISHLLDPPYPATKLLGEMKKNQEVVANMLKASEAQRSERSDMFTSWISNLNSTENTDTGLQKSKTIKRKITGKPAATGKDKPHSRVKQVKRSLRQNISGDDKSMKPSQLSAVPPSSSSSASSLPVPLNITVKTEILADCESHEANINPNMKIMAVLSIPESAFSAQVDEAEDTADGVVDEAEDTADGVVDEAEDTADGVVDEAEDTADGVVEDIAATVQTSQQREGGSICTNGQSNTLSGLKRKLTHSKTDDVDSTFGTKHATVNKQEICESETEIKGCLTDDSEIGKTGKERDIVSLYAEVKEELEIESESSTANSDSYANMECSGNENVHNLNKESYITKNHDDITRDKLEIFPEDSGVHCCTSSSEVEKPNVARDSFLSPGLDSELPVEDDLEVPVGTSQIGQLMSGSLPPTLSDASLSTSSLSTSVLLPASDAPLSNATKDSIQILRKLLQQEGKTDDPADLASKTLTDLVSRTSADLGSKTSADLQCKRFADLESKTLTNLGCKTAHLGNKTSTDLISKTSADFRCKTSADLGSKTSADLESKTLTNLGCKTAHLGNKISTDLISKTSADFRSKTSSDGGSKTSSDRRSKTSSDRGSKTSSDCRSKTFEDSESKTSADGGSKTSADLGSKTFEDSESKTSCNFLWDTCRNPSQGVEATRQKVSHTAQNDNSESECHSKNKISFSNSHADTNYGRLSAELNCKLSVDKILNLGTFKNTASLSNGQTATDIARFVDTAKRQLENILQIFSTSTIQDHEKSQQSPMESIHSQHLSEQSSGLSSQLCTVAVSESGQSPLHFLQSSPRRESSNSEYSLPSSKHCDIFNTVSAESGPEIPGQNVDVSNKNAPSPLLRSILEKPTGSETKPGESVVKAPLRSRPLKTKSVLKKKPARLKVPHLTGAHKVTQFCCRCRNKPDYRPKNNLPFRTITHHKQVYNRVKFGSGNSASEINSAKNTSTRTYLHSLDSSLLPNPSSSLLTQAAADSSSNSGFYSYRSDHHRNAAYQKVRINKQNKRSQTFTISDLPLDVPDSKRQEESLNVPTSEICLGDYFPAGTVLPVEDVKLLTRQSSSGLEVVLKFEYRVSKHETQTGTVGQLDKDKLNDYDSGE